MTHFYQISCDCGQVINVSPAQCGSSVRCRCGRILVVPSWRELAAQSVPSQDEPASGVSVSPTVGWTVVFRWLGVLLLAGSAVGGALLFVNAPRLPNLHKFSPADAYTYLKVLKTGIVGAMPIAEIAYVRYERIWRSLWDLVSVLAVIGALLVIGVSLAEWWEQKSQLAEGPEDTAEATEEAKQPGRASE